MPSEHARSLPWWTWILPGLICNAGLWLSLGTQVAPFTAAIYLPIPLGLVMAYWWGPRVLVGVFLSAMFTTGVGGLVDRRLSPLYATPDLVAVFLGWWLFVKVGRGRCWLPNLPHTIRFILLSILPAAAVNAFHYTGLLLVFHDIGPEKFWPYVGINAIATLLDGVAVAAPLAILLTPWLERRGLTRTAGAGTVELFPAGTFSTPRVVEIVAVFGAMFAIIRLIPFTHSWSIAGVFLIWAALRHGVVVAVLANLWLELVVLVLPAALHESVTPGPMGGIEHENLQLALATLCLVSLITGRTISDLLGEIAHRRRAEQAVAAETAALHASEERLSAVIRNSPNVAIQWYDRDGRVKSWNEASARMFGFSAEEALGRTLEGLIHTREEFEGFLQALRDIDRTGQPIGPTEFAFTRRSGEKGACISTVFPIPGAGSETWYVCMDVDITDRKRAHEHQRFMMMELDHRVKNNLAAVISMAHQMLAKPGSFEEFRRSFTGRIQAMARTHEALASSKWEGIDLTQLLTMTLAPYEVTGNDRVRLSGPTVVMPARTASPVCMALHELTTNAAKYGAFSTPNGRLEVEWSTTHDGPSVELRWRELDGPPVKPPERRGFGSELIEGLLVYELGGRVSVDYPPTGVVCRLVIPLVSD
jgi:PAS domain S-box-containing protein